jgi:hypothetical protein
MDALQSSAGFDVFQVAVTVTSGRHGDWIFLAIVQFIVQAKQRLGSTFWLCCCVGVLGEHMQLCDLLARAS